MSKLAELLTQSSFGLRVSGVWLALVSGSRSVQVKEWKNCEGKLVGGLPIFM